MVEGDSVSVKSNFQGKHHSEETKNKISIALKLKGIKPPSQIGRKHTAEWKENMSRIMKGRKPVITPEGRERIRLALTGRKASEETRRKMSIASKGRNAGEKSCNWRGGVTPMHKKIRKSLDYKIWRQSVYIRDKYTCVWCKQVGGKIVADHIKPFAIYPELRFSLENGRTMCESCHRKTDTYGSKTKHYANRTMAS